jgi:dTMP kinase
MKTQRGTLITFEGVEGSGKSTQVGLLSSHLKEEGYDILVAREPGGTRIGEQIRHITHDRENVELTAVAEAYLMAASRAQLIREVIRPAVTAGKIVIVDRFLDSSLAYQGFGRELGDAEIGKLNILAMDDVSVTHTILLDVSPEVGISRRTESDKIDRLDLQQTDFYRRVREGYLTLAKRNPDKITLVDSSRPIETVADSIWGILKPLLPSSSRM